MAKAKKIKKAIKSVAKKAVHHVKKAVEEETSDHGHSHIRKTIESLAHEQGDAAVIWKQIKDGEHTDKEIKAIVNSKNFFKLLGQIS